MRTNFGGGFFLSDDESKKELFWNFRRFSMLKTTFHIYWTSVKIKISMTCLQIEHEIYMKFSATIKIGRKSLVGNFPDVWMRKFLVSGWTREFLKFVCFPIIIFLDDFGLFTFSRGMFQNFFWVRVTFIVFLSIACLCKFYEFLSNFCKHAKHGFSQCWASPIFWPYFTKFCCYEDIVLWQILFWWYGDIFRYFHVFIFI